ncbi:hypothetical protein V6N13_133262 [Hibiscus sabdariffa]
MCRFLNQKIGEHPFSRGYEVILPSSFDMVLSSALVYFTCSPVSVWGTVTKLRREFRLLKRQSRRATRPGRVRKALMTQGSYYGKESEGKKGQPSARSSNSLQQIGMVLRAAALRHPIPLLSFVADLTSRAAPSCSGSSDERSSSDSEKIGQTGGYPRLTSLSIKTPSQRRA